MPTTPIGGAPYPAPTAADNVPADLQALAVWVSTRTVMTFADAAARDAAIDTPTAGMVAWLDTPGALTVRTASAWRTVYSEIDWTDIDLASGMETFGTTPQVAFDGGNFIVLRGGVQKAASGVQIAVNDVLGTIPSSFGTPVGGDWPIATQYLSQSAARLHVQTDRTITYTGPSTGWVGLNGVRIPLA